LVESISSTSSCVCGRDVSNRNSRSAPNL
jgi:hypothetical protein